MQDLMKIKLLIPLILKESKMFTDFCLLATLLLTGSPLLFAQSDLTFHSEYYSPEKVIELSIKQIEVVHEIKEELTELQKIELFTAYSELFFVYCHLHEEQLALYYLKKIIEFDINSIREKYAVTDFELALVYLNTMTLTGLRDYYKWNSSETFRLALERVRSIR